MRKMPYTGRERRQRALYRATMALWMLAVILLVQIAVVLCTSGYMKRMGGGK